MWTFVVVIFAFFENKAFQCSFSKLCDAVTAEKGLLIELIRRT